MQKRKLNSLALIVAASYSMTAFAVAPGIYLGLSTGAVKLSDNTVQVQTFGKATTPATPDKNQWGARGFLGYKINDYAALEVGFSYISIIRYSTKGVNTCKPVNVRNRNGDVSGKLTYTMGPLNVFARAGVAISYVLTSGAFHIPPDGDCGKHETDHWYRPVYGVGVGYDLSPNWVVDVNWIRYQTGNVLKNVNLFSIGIAYHFVNIYCGQFLCDETWF